MPLSRPARERELPAKEALMPDLTIAKLAAAGGVGVETIRYYQRRGLLAEPPRAGAIRRYGDGDLRRLLFIRRAQAAGFTLEEIGELLALDSSQDRGRVRALAAERLAALEARIAELEAARAALTRLAKACAAGDKGPCPIIEAFEA
jgi:MerR family mercuric resistance operon transcriptional regulator